MAILRRQYASILLLMVVTIAGALDKDCLKPPSSESTALSTCCKGSGITYLPEVSESCKYSHQINRDGNKYMDLVLMNICEIQCYLNIFHVILDDGNIEKERLINLLSNDIANDEIKPRLMAYTDVCLNEVDFMKSNAKYKSSCQPYYAALIDCIQEQIFTNCPENAKNLSSSCMGFTSFISECSVSILRIVYGGRHKPNFDRSDTNYDSSDYDSDSDSYSDSESYSDLDSGSGSSSDSESPSDEDSSSYTNSSFELESTTRFDPYTE